MSVARLSPVQLCNYMVLNLLRDQANDSPIDACATFGMTKSELEAIRSHLSPDRLLVTVANVGDSLLFSPRGDLGKILSSPPPLIGTLVACRTGERPSLTASAG